jgi:hypothetical protein
MLLLSFEQEFFSFLGQETDNSDEGFRGFPQSLRGNSKHDIFLSYTSLFTLKNYFTL